MRHVLLPRLAPYRAAPAAAPSTVAAPLEDVLVTLPKGSAVARSCRFARALNDNPRALIDDEATPYGWFVPPPLGPPAAAVTDCDDAAHCVAPYIDPPAVRHDYVTDRDVMLYDMGRVATIDYLASKLGATGVRALRQAFPIVEGAVRRESDVDIDRRLFESMLESGLVNAVVSGWYHETLPRAQSGGIHRREAVALALHTLFPNTQCGSPISRQPLSPRPSHWTPPPTPKRQATGARMRGPVAADEWKGIRAEVEEAYYRDADQLLELLGAFRARYPEAYMQWIHGPTAGLLPEAQNVGNAAGPSPLYHTPRRRSAWDALSPPSHASTAAGATPLDEHIGRPSLEDAAAAIQMREFFRSYDPDMMALRSLLLRLFSHLRAKADAIEDGRRLDFHSS